MILSGGNIDLLLLSKLPRYGHTAVGRYLGSANCYRLTRIFPDDYVLQ